MNTLPSPATLVPNSSYETTRFNALRHGVLSRHTVLPWEDRSEYLTLLAALVAEHAPDGPTEEHLVEELAGIIWRKRRLRMAEAAVYREKLRHDDYHRPEHLTGAALLPLAGSADHKANRLHPNPFWDRNIYPAAQRHLAYFGSSVPSLLSPHQLQVTSRNRSRALRARGIVSVVTPDRLPDRPSPSGERILVPRRKLWVVEGMLVGSA
jgi:hypothetical protein